MNFKDWWMLYEGNDSVQEMARTAWNAALLVAANKCYGSDGVLHGGNDMRPKDYGDLVQTCRSEPHNEE